MIRWLKRIAWSLFVLVLLATISIWWWLRSSRPVYEGEIVVPGLDSKVTAVFDEVGIPHIKADNRHDLYLAFGYLHAQERLFQMELLRRAGSGRLAEIFGPDLLPVDKMFITLGLPDYADSSATLFNQLRGTPVHEDVQHYLEGINLFLDQGNLPPEFGIIGIPARHFETRDLYAITGAMAYNFSQAQKTDFIIDDLLHRLGPDYLTDLAILHDSTESYIPDFRPDTSFRSPETAFAQAMAHVENLLPYAPLNGSNSWVLSGQKTASGKVIFCNDTHIGYLVPQTWYEAILECPDLHIHGHFMAGIPFALVGTTSKLSWGLTMLLNDDMDFYRETQDKNDPDRVIYKGNSVPLEVHAYKIPVKDADSAEVVVRTTPHGPLINAVVEGMQELPPTSLFWTYTKVPNHNIEALFGLNHARNMDEFASHLPLIHGPGLSVNYGDSEGNIAWWACAHLLKRPPHVQSFALLDGASGQDEPLGYYPFANNPRCINPPSGFIYSANDWPQAIDTTGSISGDLDYWYPGYYKPQYRADRINTLLQANDAWTTTSIQSVMNDITNTTDSALYAQLWGIILSTGKLSDQLDIADFATLFKWNGSYGREQIQPSIFSRWLYHTMRLACEDEMGKENFRLFISGHLYQRAYSRLITSANSLWWDNVSTSDSRESRQAIVVAALECTLGELKQHYGPETKMWQWRKLTSVEFQHPMGKVGVFRPFFNIGPMITDGGNETIRQCGFTADSIPVNRAYFGSQMRIIWDYDRMEGFNITPCGQSGHIMSPHYKDQAERYCKGEFRPMVLENKTGSVLELIPE